MGTDVAYIAEDIIVIDSELLICPYCGNKTFGVLNGKQETITIPGWVH